MRDAIGKIGKLSLLSTLLISTGVLADEADVFNLYASAAYTYDSNLFRLADGVDPTPLVGKSDRSDNVLGLTAGVVINQPISQQRIKLDASVNHNAYANYGFLDYDALQYNGTWFWHLTPRISGIASMARSESLVGFDRKSDYAKTVRTSDKNLFEADYWLTGSWHALAGYVQDKQSDTTVVQQENAFNLKGWSAGARFDPGSGRTLELRYLKRDGEYANTNASFSQDEFEARLIYPFNDKTRMAATVARVDRSHPNKPARDYSGWRGKLGLDWLATGKVGLNAEYRRRLESWQDVYSSYYTSDSLSVGPYWAVTAKQKLSAGLVFSKDRYDGAPASWAGPLRDDKRQALVLGWTWEPTRTIDVGASVRHERRDSNLSGLDYKDTSVGLNVRVMF
ncbi:MAG: outer membrane beta-barrel protein [Gallionellaceae bacterium]|nr:outer membrane beta-barrel protein [Gallionellaceae bacterium]